MLSSILSKINMPLIWVILGSIIIFGYMRIDSLKSKLEVEVEKSDRLTTQIINLDASYKKFSSQVQIDLTQQKQITNTLTNLQYDNKKQLEQLRSTFNHNATGGKRDMDKIIEGKPTLLERLINNATIEVGKEVETVTNYRN